MDLGTIGTWVGVVIAAVALTVTVLIFRKQNSVQEQEKIETSLNSNDIDRLAREFICAMKTIPWRNVRREELSINDIAARMKRDVLEKQPSGPDAGLWSNRVAHLSQKVEGHSGRSYFVSYLKHVDDNVIKRHQLSSQKLKNMRLEHHHTVVIYRAMYALITHGDDKFAQSARQQYTKI